MDGWPWDRDGGEDAVRAKGGFGEGMEDGSGSWAA